MGIYMKKNATNCYTELNIDVKVITRGKDCELRL